MRSSELDDAAMASELDDADAAMALMVEGGMKNPDKCGLCINPADHWTVTNGEVPNWDPKAKKPVGLNLGPGECLLFAWCGECWAHYNAMGEGHLKKSEITRQEWLRMLALIEVMQG